MYLDAFAKLRKGTIIFVLSVCPSVRTPAWNNSASNRRGSMKFDIWGFSPKSVEKIEVLLKSEIIPGTLHEDRCTFCITSRSVVLRMRNVSGKIIERIKTHILCSVTFFPPKIVPFWDNVQKYCRSGRPQITIWRMRIACWIPKATNTHLKCVIHVAFQLQQYLHEHTSRLRHNYIFFLLFLIWPVKF